MLTVRVRNFCPRRTGDKTIRIKCDILHAIDFTLSSQVEDWSDQIQRMVKNRTISKRTSAIETNPEDGLKKVIHIASKNVTKHSDFMLLPVDSLVTFGTVFVHTRTDLIHVQELAFHKCAVFYYQFL